MRKINIKIADYFIVGFILFIGLAGFWFNLQEAGAAGHKYAVIYLANKQIAELSLTQGESFSYTFSFGDNNEHRALVEIENGRIRMLPLGDELCPRAICSHTGWIEHSYESIVCLPNQIMISFHAEVSGRDELDLDGVTY